MESRLRGHARFHGSFSWNKLTCTQVKLEILTDLLKLDFLVFVQTDRAQPWSACTVDIYRKQYLFKLTALRNILSLRFDNLPRKRSQLELNRRTQLLSFPMCLQNALFRNRSFELWNSSFVTRLRPKNVRPGPGMLQVLPLPPHSGV